MATPLWSYRVPLEQRDLLKRVADRLKRDPSAAARIEAALQSSSAPVGLFKDEEAALQFICDRLMISLDPDSIWLFGSRARRDHRPDSDFDILVVLPDELGAKSKDYRHVLEPLAGSGLACDVVPCPRSDFEEAMDISGTLAFDVFHNGRLLYQKRQPKIERSAA
ncbi:MAG TPA: nucleotidyltransferase domain-containing protein [Stellaceae bacterium]|nr:nucleotidyltransferase domain-containing protein [Stellaceae bacterium]